MQESIGYSGQENESSPSGLARRVLVLGEFPPDTESRCNVPEAMRGIDRDPLTEVFETASLKQAEQRTDTADPS